MWSWLRNLLPHKRGGALGASADGAAQAATGGVAIGGNNYGSIFTGPVNIPSREEPGEDAAWAEGLVLCERLFRQIAHARFDSSTVV
ncbi:hypothetical protein PY254_17955 [Rhodanobacter sp. AS-Z3]|uniref:hypothetical protein n=1 Tax=Rhodanobacter sp. AS-Z3 TaxID=3031330 RepID=UPI002479CBC2|nr:hypothetical protein [Rhodanobacter sp. AS-Z3]WEN15086.1 hypothetical protein PY254_17955 [Rhodanobacter sp. AS-Z3]